ncbi:hypothetical protein D9M71_689750 [compost metagenome]
MWLAVIRALVPPELSGPPLPQRPERAELFKKMALAPGIKEKEGFESFESRAGVQGESPLGRRLACRSTIRLPVLPLWAGLIHP